METVEIKNPYQTRDLPIDKHSIVDIACTDKSGIKYLVEMQVDNVKGFANRMLFTEGAGCSRATAPRRQARRIVIQGN